MNICRSRDRGLSFRFRVGNQGFRRDVSTVGETPNPSPKGARAMQRTAYLATAAIAAILLASPASAQKKGGDITALMYAGFNSVDPHFTATYQGRTVIL